jgi:V/A-type H+-transporting ATPase subunit I
MFNIIIGVFVPGIQSARLVYVEFFSKFYEGNGRKFNPFGSVRKFTQEQYEPEQSMIQPEKKKPDKPKIKIKLKK